MSIYKKLLDFQKQNISVTKDAKNPFFKSNYVTLNEVLAKVKQPLNDLGILIRQESDEKGLRTVLTDTEDDSSVSSYLPYVEANTAQKLGSNITYNRRYSLVALLSLEDTDDDGNRASGNEHPVVTKIKSGKPFTGDELEQAVEYAPDEAYGAVTEANKQYRADHPPVKRNPDVQFGKKATGERLKQTLTKTDL